MKRTNFILLFLLIALLVAGCGKTAKTSDTLSMTIEGLDTFAYAPNALMAPAGAEVTLTYKNPGVLTHNWILLPEQETDFLKLSESDALGGVTTGLVASGAEKVITFTAPNLPGTYQFACIVPGHAIGGMVGTFTVTSASEALK